MTKIRVPSKIATFHKTFETIRKRMAGHNVTILKYINEDTLKVFESPLDGIEFKVKTGKSQEILHALRIATKSSKQSFREGKKPGHSHLPFDISMGATKGIGFREILYLNMENTPPLQEPRASLRMRPLQNSIFQTYFTNKEAKIDISSLHCAVDKDFCSIHIDETGFVLQANPLGKDVIVTPDFLHHLLLELLWKGIPGMPGNVEIYAPNSANQYSNFGLRGTADITSNIKLVMNVSYTIRGERGFAHTLTLDGKF